jgi:hypothetical protein
VKDVSTTVWTAVPLLLRQLGGKLPRRSCIRRGQISEPRKFVLLSLCRKETRRRQWKEEERTSREISRTDQRWTGNEARREFGEITPVCTHSTTAISVLDADVLHCLNRAGVCRLLLTANKSIHSVRFSDRNVVCRPYMLSS